MYLWVFFWKNGMPPQRAVYWTMRHRSYDREAWRSIQDLVKKTETKSGRDYLNKIPVMDLIEGRVT